MQAAGIYATAEIYHVVSLLVSDKVFKARMAICEACEFYTKLGTCGNYPQQPVKYNGRTHHLCGCPMKLAKGRMAFAKCPVGKWGNLKLRQEQLDKARELVNKYTDSNGHIKQGSVNANELVGIWKVLTNEHANAGCNGCVKELIRNLQRYLHEQNS